MRLLWGLSLSALAACGANEEKTTIGDTSFSSNEAAGTASIATKDGRLNVIDGAAADQIVTPRFAPKYPGSLFESALIASSKEKGQSTTINFTTTDSLTQIAAFYREQFAAQGLSIGMNMVADDSIMITADADGKSASVLAAITDGKLGGVLTYSGE